MIYILHGEDTSASYDRLKSFIKQYRQDQIVRLTPENTPEEFYLAAFSMDIFSSNKLVICENILSGKLSPNIFKKVPGEKTIIFWEHKKLPLSILEKLKNIAKIEHFKPQPELFWFLDSLGLNLKVSLAFLNKLTSENEMKINWNLASRFLQLILAKQKFVPHKIEGILGKKIENWQWQKILTQSKYFDLKTLLSLYNGVLKIDYLIKSGKSSLDIRTLTSVLLLKYLPK